MRATTCLAVLLIAAGAYAAWHQRAGERTTGGSGEQTPFIPDAVAIALADEGARPAGSRPVYPYSVISGGVRGAADLQRAVDRDPVVAKHFAGFDMSRVRVVELARAHAAHVAYRVEGQIYWTREKLQLPRGERLLTDGTNYARARCGNRVSDVAQAPTSPAEPSPAVLDTPMGEDIDGVLLTAHDLDPEGDPPTGVPPGGDGGAGEPLSDPDAGPGPGGSSPGLPRSPSGGGGAVARGPGGARPGGDPAGTGTPGPPGWTPGPAAPAAPPGAPWPLPGTPGSPSIPWNSTRGGPGLPPPTGWPPPPAGDPDPPVDPPWLGDPNPPAVAVPAPGTLLLLVAGLAGYGALCSRRRGARRGGRPPGPEARSSRSPGGSQRPR